MSMKKPKVYVVTSGSYSDYSIEAIFSNREAAKRFVGPQKDESVYGGHRIEVHDLLAAVPEKITRYYLKLESNGSIHDWSASWWPWDLTTRDLRPVIIEDEWRPIREFGGKYLVTAEQAIASGFPFALAHPSGRIVALYLAASGTDEEAVRKSFYDRLATRKAEVADIAS